MLCLSFIPQNCAVIVAVPELMPNRARFNKNPQRPATPIAAVLTLPSPTVIAVSTSWAHEVSSCCRAIGIAKENIFL